MDAKETYRCDGCGEEIDLKDREVHEAECPGLHGLDPCRKTDTAEHARGGDDDDSCYDGREGKL